jgi:putative aldouronate transport system substrate-binding protein
MSGDDVVRSMVSRRRFLENAGRGIAASAIGLPLLVEACAPTAPPAPPVAPTAAPKPTSASVTPTSPPTIAAAVKPAGVLPTYVALSSKPKPDFPAKDERYEDGYLNYPANPTRSVPEAPGMGGTFNAMTIGLFPPPTPFDQNAAWQAVNKALNATMQFTIVPQSEYPAKMGVLMAGGDLPDFTFFFGGNAIASVPGLPQFLQSQTADLTPFLAGDAVKEYPNLAANASFAWRNTGSVYNGKVLMVPKPSYTPGFVFVKNTTMWDKDIGKDVQPKSADDFRRILKELTHPQEGRWGIGSYPADSAFGLLYLAAYFGAPNNWRLESDGKLTRNYETPEFRAAVGFVRELFTDGVYHPDSAQLTSNVVARGEFAAGKWAVWHEAFNVGWSDAWRRGRTGSTPFEVHLVNPFPAQEGGKTFQYLGTGTLGATALKKAAPERIKEQLRILNYLAAPFGTQEDVLLSYGLPGVDYNLDSAGNPIVTDRGNADANYVPWKYVTQRPPVLYLPDIPDFAQQLSAAENIVIPIGVSDPTVGFVSDTAVAKNVVLNNAALDGIRDILVGRRPLADLDQVVKEWQTGGGEQMRREYMEAIARAQ